MSLYEHLTSELEAFDNAERRFDMDRLQRAINASKKLKCCFGGMTAKFYSSMANRCPPGAKNLSMRLDSLKCFDIRTDGAKATVVAVNWLTMAYIDKKNAKRWEKEALKWFALVGPPALLDPLVSALQTQISGMIPRQFVVR